MEDNSFLSAKAAASAHGVHVKTIYRWAQLGYLEVERVGNKGHYRVPLDSLPERVQKVARGSSRR